MVEKGTKPLKIGRMEANPYQDYDGVEMIEGKVSGMPLLKGSRVPADLVAECLDEGETVAEIAYNYTLNPADVLRFKLYRESLRPALKP